MNAPYFLNYTSLQNFGEGNRFLADEIIGQQNQTSLPAAQQVFTLTWYKILWLYICIQAFIGMLAIEYAWMRT